MKASQSVTYRLIIDSVAELVSFLSNNCSPILLVSRVFRFDLYEQASITGRGKAFIFAAVSRPALGLIRSFSCCLFEGRAGVAQLA